LRSRTLTTGDEKIESEAGVEDIARKNDCFLQKDYSQEFIRIHELCPKTCVTGGEGYKSPLFQSLCLDKMNKIETSISSIWELRVM